ncbi:alpha/beta fold hydrolase [Aquabacterium sp. OR-4]|uniref:alpha/beta fold hydrolase n=1 Tax=Aquabacterium sp. OR-4 TaxID=2978127 RepID=UPI0021B1D520|nr:alpha/beta fold hydrolase [Aquabacterium sp. OR-4]MDT7836851.1 alpha/beta fold hydrolase [Aquabacterium sp. OR-4]
MGALLLRLFGLLLLLSALALPLVRAPDRPVDTLVARWAPPPSQFLDLGGQLVHFRDEGPRQDPVPLLLLHGTSASLHTWDGWVRALRGTRRVISLDLPAFGLTGPFDGPYAGRPYTGEQYARFVLDVLDQLKLPRVSIAGNSLGGEVAWRIAASAPQRVERLILVDAAGYQRNVAQIPLGWRIARVPVLGRVAEHVLPQSFIREGLSLVMGDPAHVTEAMVERYHELTLREGNRAALIERARQWTPDEGVAQVRGVTQPTLVLWGGRDRLIPPATAQRFAADIPGAQVQVFDDLGHIPHEEDPARTVAVVQAFLK